VSRGGAILAGSLLALVVYVLSFVPLWASMTLCAGLAFLGLTLILIDLWRRRS
jgi:hypothetical protein